MNTLALTETGVQATRVAVPYTVNINSLTEAMQFAQLVASSQFAPASMRGKPEDCLLAMQFGAELGLRPMQALQNVAVINGKPSIFGDAALALVKMSPDFESIQEFIECSNPQNKAAVCIVKRKGEPEHRAIFSTLDAEKAGLLGKPGPWRQYTDRMLQMRARGFALRDVFPHVLKGLIFTEEAQDYPAPVDITPRAVEAAALVDSAPAGEFVNMDAPAQTPAQRAAAVINKETAAPVVNLADDIPDTKSGKVGNNTKAHRALEAALRDAGLAPHRERVKAWISAKWSVGHFPDLTIEQARELRAHFPAMAAKVKKEERAAQERVFMAMAQCLADNGHEWETPLKHYQARSPAELDDAQLSGAIAWCQAELKAFGLKVDADNRPELREMRKQADAMREGAHRADRTDTMAAELAQAAELERMTA